MRWIEIAKFLGLTIAIYLMINILITITETKKITNKEGKMSAEYESDFNFWLEEQTRLLKEHKFEDLDIENLINELNESTWLYKFSLESHLTYLFLNILHDRSDPNYDKNNWNASIAAARLSINNIIENSPSLEKYFKDIYTEKYEECRDIAIKESGLPKTAFPIKCPWSFEEILR